MKAAISSVYRLRTPRTRAIRYASTHASPTPQPIQRAIKASYYRGGTSRGLIIQPQNLPRDRSTWPALFLQLMGSPDPYGRQLDGMGAGISSLSKICLVEPAAQASRRKSRHNVDYTFVGIGIEGNEVDVAGNCGNLSSAIGPYAYNAGLLPPHFYETKDGQVTVRMRQTNTRKYIISTFDVVQGQAAVSGSYAIDGVSGTAAKIKLDFLNPFGSKTGKVLPTGKKIDMISGYRATCLDGANPCVYVRADEVGVPGTILPNEFNTLSEKLELLEKIRKAAAVAMGLAKTEDEVARTVPKIGIVSMSSTHQVLSGATVKSSQVDLVVRFLSDTQPHRAIPLTAALTTAVVARIPGTIVEQLLAPDPATPNAITIGHASGKIQVNATMDQRRKWKPLSATVYRTSRRIFDGDVYWTDSSTSSDQKIHSRSSNPSIQRSLGLTFVEESRGQIPSELEPRQISKPVGRKVRLRRELDHGLKVATPGSLEEVQHTKDPQEKWFTKNKRIRQEREVNPWPHRIELDPKAKLETQATRRILDKFSQRAQERVPTSRNYWPHKIDLGTLMRDDIQRSSQSRTNSKISEDIASFKPSTRHFGLDSDVPANQFGNSLPDSTSLRDKTRQHGSSAISSIQPSNIISRSPSTSLNNKESDGHRGRVFLDFKNQRRATKTLRFANRPGRWVDVPRDFRNKPLLDASGTDVLAYYEASRPEFGDRRESTKGRGRQTGTGSEDRTPPSGASFSQSSLSTTSLPPPTPTPANAPQGFPPPEVSFPSNPSQPSSQSSPKELYFASLKLATLHRKLNAALSKQSLYSRHVRELSPQISKTRYMIEHNVHIQGCGPPTTPKVSQEFFNRRRLERLEKKKRNAVRKVGECEERVRTFREKIEELGNDDTRS